MNDEIVSFGEWVQARRNQLGLSRTGLARQVGCSPVTIKKIERDERRPSVQIAELLATNLQIPESEQEDFIRRARGEFVPTLISPEEMTLAEAQAPAAEADAPKHNLPPQTTPFFGREQELADIASNLADPICRLLTILGAGGMGKTRLSIEAAAAQKENFTDGVVFVPLAAVEAPVDDGGINPLVTAVADALNISLQANNTPDEELFNFLQRKEMLLVLDNFEQLLNQADFVSSLLARAFDIKLLVTSRERLNLQEEWLFPLAGLSTPGEGSTDRDAVKQPTSAAVHLFAQRARQIQPAFDLAAEYGLVVKICQIVDGMPLALELAASWRRWLSSAEIIDEMSQTFDFLTTSTRNVPERHRSLRAIFDYSWQTLSEQEQGVYPQLSIFKGGFTDEAAKQIAGSSRPILFALIDKSLLNRGQNGRYHIHELLRQFAAEKLAQVPDATANTRYKHSRFYLNLLHQSEPALLGAEANVALAEIREDIGNVREAWRWGITHQPQDLSLPTIHSLFLFYESDGLFLEAKNVSEQAMQLLQSRYGPPDWGNTISQNYLQLGLLQTFRAFAYMRMGQYDVAEGIFRETVSLLEGAGQRKHWVAVMCRAMLGATLHYSDQLTLSHSYLQESIELQHGLDNQYIRGMVLSVFGQLKIMLGHYDEAEQLAHASNRILNIQNNQLLRPFNFSTLGRVAMARGEYEVAEVYHQKALNMRVGTNTRAGIAFTWSDLADVAMMQGKLDQAQHYLHQALTFEDESNMRRGVDATNTRLGQLAAAKGNNKLAKQYFAKTGGRRISQLWTVMGTGWVYLKMNELDQASQTFRDDLQIMKEANRPPAALDAVAGLAHLRALAGDPQRALELIALVLNHPATAYESKERLMTLKAELEAELPTEVVAAAEAHGRELDLWETAESIIAEGTAS